MSKKPLPETNASQYINIIRERPPPFNFGLWVYNSKEGTVFGRTASSWGKIFIFALHRGDRYVNGLFNFMCIDLLINSKNKFANLAR